MKEIKMETTTITINNIEQDISIYLDQLYNDPSWTDENNQRIAITAANRPAWMTLIQDLADSNPALLSTAATKLEGDADGREISAIGFAAAEAAAENWPTALVIEAPEASDEDLDEWEIEEKEAGRFFICPDWDIVAEDVEPISIEVALEVA